MDTKANYTIVGLFVIALTVVLIMGFIWLSGFSHHKNYRVYLVYARGSVTGLNADSPVQFNGVRVGSVSKIQLDADNPQFVKLYLKVESGTPITQSTVATLVPQGITGLVYIGLKAESAKAPLLQAEKGQPYPIIPYEKPLLIQLSEALPVLAKNIGEMTDKIKKVLSDQNINHISDTLTHLEKFSGMLDRKSGIIGESFTSLNTVLKNSAGASRYFGDTLIAAQQTAHQLNKTSAQISLELSRFGQQTLPSVEELLVQLNEMTINLQQISQNLAANPAILIRGKQPPPPGPGE
jgi:phospholipid/cholesterol/gamma-HCH transport system substrate-binding protein